MATFTPADRLALRAQLVAHEGVRDTPYRCTAGHLTIGIGWNLDAHPLPADVLERHLTAYPLRPVDIDRLYDIAVDRVIGELRRGWAPFDRLDAVRQRALVDMGFNLGVPRLLGFRLMLRALAMAVQAPPGDAPAYYEDAAEAALDSKWARSDVQSARSHRVSEMLRTGVDPGAE